MAHQMEEKHKVAERARAITHLQCNHSLERRKEEAKVKVDEEPVGELGSERKLYLAGLNWQQFINSDERQLCCHLQDRLTILEDELVETKKELAFEKEENASLRKANKRLQKELEELKRCHELTLATVDISDSDSLTNNSNVRGVALLGAEARPVSPTQPQKHHPSFVALPPLGLPPVAQYQ